jgi:hypothetical protein
MGIFAAVAKHKYSQSRHKTPSAIPRFKRRNLKPSYPEQNGVNHSYLKYRPKTKLFYVEISSHTFKSLKTIKSLQENMPFWGRVEFV